MTLASENSLDGTEAGLSVCVLRLSELFDPAKAIKCMNSPQLLLAGHVPAELIQAGKVDDVLRAIDQLADGVYL